MAQAPAGASDAATTAVGTAGRADVPLASRARRMLEPTLAVGGLAAATIALHLRDPHVAGSWGFCPTAAMGFWCPGCGGLRAVNDLTHGRVADAASSNLFLFVAGPFLVAALGWWVLRRWQGRPARPADRTVFVAAAVLVVSGLVFSVLRNGPVPWLAP